MFKHLLVPTDGSPLSEAAAAKPRFHPFTLRPEQLEDTSEDRWDNGVVATNDHP